MGWTCEDAAEVRCTRGAMRSVEDLQGAAWFGCIRLQDRCHLGWGECMGYSMGWKESAWVHEKGHTGQGRLLKDVDVSWVPNSGRQHDDAEVPCGSGVQEAAQVRKDVWRGEQGA